MQSLIRVDGAWPGQVTIAAGWFRARARPWNDQVRAPLVRLDRGGAEFLTAVTQRLLALGANESYSPALYPGSTRIWRRSGYEPYVQLQVLERSLNGVKPRLPPLVHVEENPDWGTILDIDRAAFDGFWGMSDLGLREAHETNKSTALLTAEWDEAVSGYAIVGSQWGVAYLHRIAVHPNLSGHGLGAWLMEAAMTWGRHTGARSIILNVRSENARARRLYERVGFTPTGTDLQVLRYRGC